MEDFLAKLVVFGMPAIAVVSALTELFKRLFKLDGDKVPFVALGSGFAVAGSLLLIDLVPAAEPFVMYMFGALLLGLGAMGAYSGTKAVMGYTAVPKDSIVKEPSGEVYRTPPPEGGGI